MNERLLNYCSQKTKLRQSAIQKHTIQYTVIFFIWTLSQTKNCNHILAVLPYVVKKV